MRFLTFAVLAAVAGGAAAPAFAQTPTAVTAIQGLSFGSLIAGVAEPVRTTEAWRRAEARVEGDRNVDVRLVLPTALVGAGGASIPLQFTAGDGSVTLAGSTQAKTFDPNTGAKIQFKPTVTSAMLYLGGTALPAANQPAGNYSATIVIIVSKPGQ
jgi:hypothetical protein